MELRKKLKVQQVHRIPWNAMTLASTYLSCASLLEMMEFRVLWCRQKWLVLLYQVDKLTTVTSLENIHFSLLCCFVCAHLHVWGHLFQLVDEITKRTDIFVIYLFTGPPTCRSLELAGSMVEGGRLTFHAEYTGGWDIHYWCSRLSLMLLAKLFPSHSSLRGSCIHEWFRLHDDGRKEKLTAGGQFV